MSTEEDFDYEDVTVYTLDSAEEEEMLLAQNECTFIWANKEGWPVGVIMSYVWRDGCFWLTLSRQRARVPAVRRDPRVSVCVTSKGTKAAPNRTVTYKGNCEVLEDADTKAWFYPALAAAIRPTDAEWQRHFVTFLDSPRRVIFKVTPTQRIGYDGQKMGKATAEFIAGQMATGS
jgi:nitroimidazol reductase NimA-like FMN-containing flavoprotein (pyridoxamine 5'-phosphate oxidase superfamily)